MRAIASFLLLFYVRLSAADGAIDSTFGNGGFALTGLNDFFTNSPAALQDDGKVLVCGSRYFFPPFGSSRLEFFVVRFNAGGSIDASFGTQGHAVVDFAASAGAAGADECTALALQSDGKIVVAGSSTNYTVGGYDFAIARLNANGALDTTFGGHATGKTTLGFDLALAGNNDDKAQSMAIQPDGRIVLAGSASNDAVFASVRLLPDGTPDTSFNLTGRVTVAFPVSAAVNDARANSVAIDATGNILLAGYCYNASNGGSGGEDFAAVRLLPDGSLDTGFGTLGRVTVGFDLTGAQGDNSDRALAATLQRDGRIVLVGSSTLTPAIAGLQRIRSALRLMPNGAADTAFGTGGKKTWPPSANNSDDSLRAAVEQSDGKLVLAGATGYVGYTAVVMRLDGSATFDPSFGASGTQTFDFGLTSPSIQTVSGVALLGGKPIISGAVQVNNGGENNCCQDLFVARLENDLIFSGNFE